VDDEKCPRLPRFFLSQRPPDGACKAPGEVLPGHVPKVIMIRIINIILKLVASAGIITTNC
jgi:hypothetical protein